MPREKDTYLNREGLEYYHEKVKREFATKQELNQGLDTKQDKLTSQNAGDGISITIDQSGKVIISNTNVSAEWGNIQGNITDQTDLINYIDQNGGKIDKIKVNNVEQPITNKTVDITVPTKTSDIINDSGFITGITSSDVTSALGYTPLGQLYVGTTAYNILSVSKASFQGITGITILYDNNGNTEYIFIPDGDGFNTGSQQILTTVAQTYATKQEIPTLTSELTNDSGFITNEVNDLVHYYDKTEVDTIVSEASTYTAGNGIDITNHVISIKDSIILDCGHAPVSGASSDVVGTGQVDYMTLNY